MPRPPDPDDIFDRLDEVERARVAVVRELERLGHAVEEIRRMRSEGQSMAEIIQRGPGPVARRRAREAWLGLNSALHAYRAEVVRVIVDEDRWTIAAVARAMGTARQVVSRLYQFAASRPDRTPPSR